MAQPNAGDTCIKCDEVIRQVRIPSSSLASSTEEHTFDLNCGCDDLEGPRVAD